MAIIGFLCETCRLVKTVDEKAKHGLCLTCKALEAKKVEANRVADKAKIEAYKASLIKVDTQLVNRFNKHFKCRINAQDLDHILNASGLWSGYTRGEKLDKYRISGAEVRVWRQSLTPSCYKFPGLSED